MNAVLVANKCDLENERDVSTQEGQHLARQWDCAFFEASAKTRMNVDEAFFEAVRRIRIVEGGGPINRRNKDETKTGQRRLSAWKQKSCLLF